MPNFIEIGQTSLEKCIKKRYLFGPSRHFFVTDGQKRDYLSRVSQHARGATKNSPRHSLTAINNVIVDGLLLIAPTVLEATLKLRPNLYRFDLSLYLLQSIRCIT